MWKQQDFLKEYFKKKFYLKDFFMEEDAVGVVEIILILVVLIALVVLFKSQLTNLVEKLLSKVTSQSNTI